MPWCYTLRSRIVLSSRTLHCFTSSNIKLDLWNLSRLINGLFSWDFKRLNLLFYFILRRCLNNLRRWKISFELLFLLLSPFTKFTESWRRLLFQFGDGRADYIFIFSLNWNNNLALTLEIRYRIIGLVSLNNLRHIWQILICMRFHFECSVARLKVLVEFTYKISYLRSINLRPSLALLSAFYFRNVFDIHFKLNRGRCSWLVARLCELIVWISYI